MLNSKDVQNMIKELSGMGFIEILDNSLYVCNLENINKEILVEQGKIGVHGTYKYVTIKQIKYKDEYVVIEQKVEQKGYIKDKQTTKFIIPYSSIKYIRDIQIQ